ncbi:KRR1-interacting protein involved in 40S ribosome biogenesis [Handroanthus impetiginosus]|uniref:KRR1-interacting protein involved in 40S ribosome biogenesis n=1 Tax=Handroanthus impetiginosus TaxID=429701 RepID=A0A2G9H1I9_9LAMI|nr:KRR1-interacting protein involved in 40S ribosome biogenesis [Handroanthus impetiginosus]
MGRLKLFDDDDESPDDFSKIEINHEFAKRYEHNKRREELQRYEELKKQGRLDSSDSDSEESSEDEEVIKPSKKTDSEFFDALIKIRNQDPLLRNKDAKLFDSDSESEEDSDNASEEKEKKEKKKKPMYLKDVVSKQLIEAGAEFDDEEKENVDNEEEENRVKTYAEEQEQLRMEFLKAVEEEENDEEGDFLKVKSGNKEEDEDEDDDDDFVGKLDEYFGEDEKLDEDTKFLKDYFRSRMWIDNKKSDGMGDDEIEFSEDEEEIEKQEDYEREYNFRFEENAGDRVWGHARKVEGSVRKKDNARKLQRERKEERMAQAEFERKEELKRLKNLKKQEINEKLEKIREVAGIGMDGSVFLDEDDLEEDFDPDDYDKKMKEAFGDGYYEAEDVDPEFGSDPAEDDVGLEKPDFDKEDELLGLPKGWDDVNKSGEGFISARQRILKERVVDGDDNEIGKDGDNEPKEGKRKRKRKPSEVEKAVREQLMEEYYKLDYEDTIGDLKTRFKYKTVNPKRYGLTPEEMLMMDEKELNQYVSLKKLAPYREKEWKVPRIKTLQLKQKTENLHKGDASDSVNEDRKETR